MSALTEYDAYVAGADANDRRTFDAFLIGWLLNAVDDETRTQGLESAAAYLGGTR